MANSEEEHTHHVKFEEAKDQYGHNDILVEVVEPGRLRAHLGFLKFNHKYSIVIPLELSDSEVDLNWIAGAGPGLSTYTTFKEYEGVSPTKGNLHLELKAGKAKLMTDIVKLINPADKRQLEVVLVARVLDKGQGTPMLKDGIHCIAVADHDDESEASDWQGFD